MTALRWTFDATMANAAFRADAEIQKLELQPVSGEQIQALVGRMFAAPADVVVTARRAIEELTRVGGRPADAQIDRDILVRFWIAG